MTAPFPSPAPMPEESHLEMLRQDFGKSYRDANAKSIPSKAPVLERFFLFGFAIVATAGLALIFGDWFRSGGFSALEGGIVALAIFTFFWIALSVAMALLGCLPQRTSHRDRNWRPLNTALLLPVYGESAEGIERNITVMLDDLRRSGCPHPVTMYVLSDTRDAAKVTHESRMVARLQRKFGDMVHYRHREENIRYKAGNIEEWVTRWGARHEAMLVLDADSVMTGKAMRRLMDALAAEPSLGLVQSVPRLFGARSLFGRLQQFANTIYGTTLARGLAKWAGDEANYWGHNAIMRVRAFAACAGLPELPGRAPFGGTVMSHDFVEAALMRRAGWGIRFLPEIKGSYEETPDTLTGHILRDRRWCQGNLQHMRLLGSAGFKTVSRVHLFQGAMAYCASLGWFALLVLWVIQGILEAGKPVEYFSADNPLYVSWPEMHQTAKIVILCLVYGMLVAPKVIGAVRYWVSDPGLENVGGGGRFVLSWLFEVLFSVVLAPLMMIQHIGAVLRTLAGVNTGWKPHASGAMPAREYVRFHAVELAVAVVMFGLFATGYLSAWLLPVAISLIVAPLLNWFTAQEWRWGMAILQTPQEVAPPPVLRQWAFENGTLEAETREPEPPVMPLPA
ncbi:glucans biosynthesis glucosyltransferase MdoH [Algicella marina]|uniref:Glucans biosynthesis glucosyltransferase H n=1 Tax=Algicella marina TaxID=2683284 RepID=A0A6P1T541_9RHOB|nr:glucans biosynthesis glucosyltransferase MdoH [Algicella marina]QHQ36891.1 glucans biosynthesis glucosyltransferase MdoH [Algicella marina]